jgi:enoyl-CoA hydratase/carnithine racemase
MSSPIAPADLGASANKTATTALFQLRVTSGVALVEFSDPSSSNSFSLRAAEELGRLIDQLDVKSLSGLIVRATGRMFCSGGNLDDYAAMTEASQGLAVNRRIGEILSRFADLQLPTVALVQGDCLGGGLEVLSAFDFVFSAPHALFGFWQRKIGLSFGWGGGSRLAHRISRQSLQQFATAAANLDATQALRCVLIDQICLESRLLIEAEKLLQRLAALPKQPFLEVRAAQATAARSAAAANEQQIFEALWWNPEHRAVLKSRRRAQVTKVL